MACSRQAGPQAYLGFIRETTGCAITQAEWHEMRAMALEDAVREEFYRLQADPPLVTGLACDECAHDMVVDATGVSHHLTDDGDFDYDADGGHVAYSTDVDAPATPTLFEQARANVGNLVSRERVDRDRALEAADALAIRVFDDLPVAEQSDDREESLIDAKEQMQFDAFNENVTRGTVAVIEGITRRGVRLSVNEARSRLKDKAQHRAEKAAIQKAADSEPDWLMAEGLGKSASLMTDLGDSEVMRWRLSGDMDREYPGLRERYDTILRGQPEARRFSMYSRRGNEAALAAARDVQERILEGKLDRDGAVGEIRKALDAVEVKHPEVWDTEPRGEFYRAVNEAGREMGWDEDIDW